MISNHQIFSRLGNHLRKYKRIWIIVAVAFILRILLILAGNGFEDPESTLTRPDSRIYIASAQSLAITGEFNQSPHSIIPETQRPIGYPFFLALMFKIHEGLILPVLISCLLSALVCIPIYLAGRLLNNEIAGIIGSLLYALNITSISSAPLILADTLFTFLAAWQFYFFLRFYMNNSLRDLWITIIFSSLATLVKPAGLFWIIPALFLVIIYKHKTMQNRLIAMAGTIAVFIMIVFPWMLRNHSMEAGFVVCTNTGNTLYYHSATALMSYVTGESAEVLRMRWMDQTEREFTTHLEKYSTESRKMDYKTEKAKEYILDHPLLFLRLHIQPMILAPDIPSFFEILGLTQTGRGTLDVLHRKGVIAAVNNYFGDRTWLLITTIPLLLIVLITYLGCSVQFGRWLVEKKWFLLWTFLAFVVFYLVIPGPLVMPRYQLPALPMISFMAGLGIFWIYERLRHRKLS